MITSDKTNVIMQAIMNVQQGADPVKKETKGQVGSRSYNYSNLNDTWETAKPLLKDNGLVIVQSPTVSDSNVGNFFETLISHPESGQWIRERMMMTIQRDDPQAIGAAITYYRRYMITAMLGLVPDDDNDAKDQRLATVQQKSRMVGAVKQIYPDLSKAEDIISTINNIIGKHPSRVREAEAEDAINLIKAFNLTD